ncbi:TraB/GumN family protein [Chitinophaga agri]|uniref:TraB/GumN family protein n=1 Tax=Chitinophaga agri TaxID=2703787 RepID=A0A6B9ZM43_9BACT|nr:TraB/GumN family protein [Chitinophaga agri]QHS62899.1 TraB/GumN family protein [Chitinophaga agri]
MLVCYTYFRRRAAGSFLLTTWLVLLALLSPLLSQAQHAKRADYQLLWRIEGSGINTPSYLFGTMHLTERRVFEFSDSVLLALRSADAFAMEVDMDSAMAYMLSPGGPLQDTVNYMRRLLTVAEYRFVDSLVKKKAGVSIDQLNLKRLWFIEKLLQEEDAVISKTAGAGAKAENIFLDGWLHQKATFMGKPVHSLEKLNNQLAFMSADVSELQKDIFLEELGYNVAPAERPGDKELFNARVKFMDSLVNLYYAGDPEQIHRLVDHADAGEGLSLNKRNVEMADNLAALIRTKSFFAAVGAAHLAGDKGMIALLRAKGLSVNPVKATFTGIAQQERRRLDSVKGYTMNKMSDGYSVVFPGVPVTYPIPGMNRKMYVGTNDNEASFALTMDLPQLGKDQQELGDMIIQGMAAQGKATLQRSYPIVYRDIPGTEAIMMQGKIPFYLRLFMRKNRAFVFMYATDAADSSARVEFFKSVRFYDIVRATSVYDSLYRPELGFSAIMPSDANYIKAHHEGDSRPVEAYTALDDGNNISYVVRVEKMKSGYYNIDDAASLVGIRNVLLRQDTTMQLIDSVVTKQDGYTLFRLKYSHHSGFISRLHFISRGNLAYTLQCTYDAQHTDSSYWKRFLEDFRILPLHAQPISVAFEAPDSSFTVKGPDAFRLYKYNSASDDDSRIYTVIDTASFASYIISVTSYSPYYSESPDSLLKGFLTSADSTIMMVANKKSVIDGRPVYDVEMKMSKTNQTIYRHALVAGHTIYCLSAFIPDEVTPARTAQQLFASFRPGKQQLADTLRLENNKVRWLMSDLQSSDTAVFNHALGYLSGFEPDSLDRKIVKEALQQPFPNDTNGIVRTKLLMTMDDEEDDLLVSTAEKLFTAIKDTTVRVYVLNFLSNLTTDSSIRTFIRLAPAIAEGTPAENNIFTYNLDNADLYDKYLPGIIAAAEQSNTVLQHFVYHAYYDSIWLAPRITQNGLDKLIPRMIPLFERQLKALDADRGDEAREEISTYRVLSTGSILASPDVQVPAEIFSRLVTDSLMAIRALGARGLINHGARVDDKVLKSILNDYNVGYDFFSDMENDKQLPRLNHLLTQELVGQLLLTYYLTQVFDEISITDIEVVTRIKVQEEKKPAEWLILYRYKETESEDWTYIFSGPQPLDTKKFNTDPDLFHTVEDAEIVKNKKALTAEAMKAYKEYLEEQHRHEEE